VTVLLQILFLILTVK